MEFDLSAALAAMQSGAAFRVANEARPGSDYVFNSLLPEEQRFDYQAKAGSMTVRSTMAGLVGMDSPYPETGSIELSAFSEETTKIANRVRMPEKSLRDLHEFIRHVRDGGGNVSQAIQLEAINFLDKLIVQSHLDTMEYLRGQALVTGGIDWIFNKIRLKVDYGVPTNHFLPQRTGANGYGGNTSMFWSDIRSLKKLLRNDVRAFILHSNTKEMILANEANNITLLSEDIDRGTFSIVRRIKTLAGVDSLSMQSTDPRDRAQFITYDAEGELYDPTDPSRTIQIPFMAEGAILAVGNYNARRYVVGQGATAPTVYNLGYTHLAPTIEGKGRPGRWADVFTPEREPWAVEGRGVTNGLPVIEAPDRIAVASTEMS